jgi:NAD(P)-dependent dehydrogenase (short-subunit alcohol dehydrogenase family)
VKVLVLGGYGAVGTWIVATLRARGETVYVAGRDAARADRVVDLREPGFASVQRALRDVDVAINAAGVEDPALVAHIADHGVAVVDITASTPYVAMLERLSLGAPVLVNVGLAPGLTNLLAAAVHAASAGPIDLVILVGAGERHGAAGVDWTLDLLGRRFRDPGSGALVRNFTQSRTISLPGHGCRRAYRADFSDQHALSRDLGVPVRTYFGLDSRLATATLAFLTWLPGGSRVPRGLSFPGTDRWLALARGIDGTMRWASGRGQSRATASMAALATRAAVGLPSGVHHLHHVLTLADVPGDQGICLRQSVTEWHVDCGVLTQAAAR